MLELILRFHDHAARIIAKGCPIYVIHSLPVVGDLVRMKTSIPNDQVEQRISDLREALDQQMDQVMKDYA
jgi:hypothetical protein